MADDAPAHAGAGRLCGWPRRADGTPNVREARRRSDALNIGSSGGDDSRSLHQFSPSVRGPTCSNNTVGHGTWTAEFTSKENCEAAALALKQMVSTGASGQGFVQFTCVKK